MPAYVVAYYSNTLHTQGTFRAWRRMASKDKWLRIHNTQEWPDYYNEANTEDRHRFFDYYLKGKGNGWEETPRVRYALHDFEDGDRINFVADEFPAKEVCYSKYYLNGRLCKNDFSKILQSRGGIFSLENLLLTFLNTYLV